MRDIPVPEITGKVISIHQKKSLGKPSQHEITVRDKDGDTSVITLDTDYVKNNENDTNVSIYDLAKIAQIREKNFLMNERGDTRIVGHMPSVSLDGTETWLDATKVEQKTFTGAPSISREAAVLTLTPKDTTQSPVSFFRAEVAAKNPHLNDVISDAIRYPGKVEVSISLPYANKFGVSQIPTKRPTKTIDAETQTNESMAGKIANKPILHKVADGVFTGKVSDDEVVGRVVELHPQHQFMKVAFDEGEPISGYAAEGDSTFLDLGLRAKQHGKPVTVGMFAGDRLYIKADPHPVKWESNFPMPINNATYEGQIVNHFEIPHSGISAFVHFEPASGMYRTYDFAHSTLIQDLAEAKLIGEEALPVKVVESNGEVSLEHVLRETQAP